MTHKTILAGLLFSAALLPLGAQARHAAPPAPQPAHEWSYDGAGGPGEWGALKSGYASCGLGRRQSPIDIRSTSTSKEKLDPIKFDYKPAALKIVDNGHTIQVDHAPGSAMSVGGVRYELLQFHFHTPSEERIDGKSYPLVAHLVHKSAEGKLAVVALLFKEGRKNPAIATLWDQLPSEKGVERVLDGGIGLAKALPARQGYYNFAGSLTTPPCSEEVNWFVLKTPVEISSAQVKRFRKLYKHNARPVQPLHGRIVKESA